ncbi:hypothetical protein R84B8_01800 [Treponema sp. R8-4-B8]
MKMKLSLPIFLFALLISSARAGAADFSAIWRHPQIADKNSIFLDAALPPFLFDDFQFNFLPIELRLEYFPPLPFPIAIGVFMKTPNPNLKSFGLRASWHFNVADRFTDFYVVYSYDLGWLRNDLLAEYNDSPAEEFYFDFRFGFRRFFGTLFGLSVESGFHFESLIITLSIKIN